jgi:dTDP-4-amino-4,6-dideoxygalactose transaminase
MGSRRVAFNRPTVLGDELRYVAESVESGQLCGAGPFTHRCQHLLEEQLQVHRALLTTSCSDALEMCALLLDLRPGDEVIIPSFTFVSTANAFAVHGARPVFIDVRPDTLNLDETRLERLVTERTRAIVVVHYAGVGCEMGAIVQLARGKGIPVIEDNAHGLFGKYRGAFLGTFGCLATQSFHETKNFTCGEGGALLVNDPRYAERAAILLEKGTDRSRFLRGQVDKYTWVDFGSSYLPSDILAAFLYAQLQARERIQHRRKQVWDYYQAHLRDWASERGVQLPTVPPHCEQAYHAYYLLLPSPEARQAMIAHLKAQGVAAAFHYLPLHLSRMGQRYGGKPGDCPVAEDVSDRLLRLPFYYALTEAEQAATVSAVQEFDLPRSVWGGKGSRARKHVA